MSRPRALIVFGSRKGVVRVAPLWRAMMVDGRMEGVLVNAGQRHDVGVSAEFMAPLQLPEPDLDFAVTPRSQTRQIADVMTALEPILADLAPDLCVAVGDGPSTLAAALAATNAKVPVAHIEAGVRSHDLRVPEERYRAVTDRLARWCFTGSTHADANLAAEGIDRSGVHLVGNILIDSLDWARSRTDASLVLANLDVGGLGARGDDGFGLATLHRPESVDDPKVLASLISALVRISADLPLVFPVEPHAALRMKEHGINLVGSAIRTMPSLGYQDFVSLMSRATLVLTDSSGVQDEAVVLGVPCVTLSDVTQSPITLISGNELVGTDPDRIVAAADRRLAAPRAGATRPPLWDGHTAERILAVLAGEATSVERALPLATPGRLERRVSQTDRDGFRPI